MHFTDTYLPRRDGVVTSLRTLVAQLSATGCPALTVVPRHPGQSGHDGLLRLPAVPCGIADLRMSRWPLRGSWAAAPLAEIAAADPEIVHVHTPGPVGLLGVLAARTLGVPLVQTYHTDLHAYADAYRVPRAALSAAVRLYAHRLGTPRPAVPRPATGPGRRALAAGRRQTVLDATNTLLLAEAAALIVPTRSVLARLELPVPADRVFVIPTGVRHRSADPATVEAFRTEHAISPAARMILFVGRVSREKGVELLINAFARLAAEAGDVQLVLVGAVYDPRWLAGLLRRAGVTDRVVVTGQQPPAVVAAAYACAEVFAFPSTTDTQALVLQEAAHAGVPVVMVDAALHRDGPLAGAAVLTGHDANEFGSGIRSLLDDPAGARSLADHAARNAAGHTPEAYAAAITAVYNWCASSRRVR